MKKVLIISTDKFPRGDAGATRQEVLAKLMCLCGYDVDVMGYGKFTNFEWIQLEERINYLSLRSNQKNMIDRIKDRLLFSFRAKRYMEKDYNYDAILIVSVPYSLIKYLKKYKKKTSVILLHDSVEWYSESQFKLGKLSPSYIKKNCLNTKWIDDNFRVIAISTFLKDYFQNKGCISIRIPFIYETKNYVVEKKCDNKKLNFVYAGQLGNKDHIREFLEAVAMLENNDRNRIQVDLFGPTHNELSKTNNIDRKLELKLKDVLYVHGRVAREVVEKSLEYAHFTILFRDSNERYAKAGFPTKVVESLSHATPVLCNLSSDLDLYLKDSENSVISVSESREDIKKCLDRILSMSENEIEKMQTNARNLAVKSFDYRHFEDKMKVLLEEI